MNNIIGRDDKLMFDFCDYEVPSKIDTGAETNSIHCNNFYIKDGILYCDLLDLGNVVPFKNYQIKTVKSSNGIKNKRYCINLNFNVGQNQYNSEFTLNDRTNMKYPILMGKNFLRDNGFIVDVNQTMNERIKKINSIIKEEVDNVNQLKKVAFLISPPYLKDIYYNFNVTDSEEIMFVLETLFMQKIKPIKDLSQKINNGSDIFLMDFNPLPNGKHIWFYFENEDAWQVRVRNDNGNNVKSYGYDGDGYWEEYYDDNDVEYNNN